MASKFCNIALASPIEVFAVVQAYNDDNHPKKVNLSIGAYRCNEGKPWVLPVVKTVEAQMASDNTLNHEYLPVAGMPDFRTAAVKMLLGSDSPAIAQNRVEGIQAPGGTGALRVAADFLHNKMGYSTVYVSNPTWGNHKGIFKACGFTEIREYRYWKHDTRSLDLDNMLADLRNAPPMSVVILHAVAHNPTGVDPSQKEWELIADVCQEKDLFVIMDNAYQGFTSGNIDTDAWSVRYFVERGFEFFIAQSFSKNFGLYNERTGNLCLVAKDTDSKTRIRSQCELCVRTNWSNPPNHGARIVATVLNNPALFAEWKEHISMMSGRIRQMRDQLFQKLKALGTPGNWEHIIRQQGMFCYTGLDEEQVDKLRKKSHIYMMKSGRINMCGLTTSNMDYVAGAINSVVTENANANDQASQQAKM